MAEQRISDARLKELAASKRPRSTSALLARELIAARELLREIEWKGWPGVDGRGCPCCEEEEHTPESWRLTALKGERS